MNPAMPKAKRQAGANRIRMIEVTTGMIEAGVTELGRLGVAMSAREAPGIVANLWSAVEARRRREMSGKVPARRRRG